MLWKFFYYYYVQIVFPVFNFIYIMYAFQKYSAYSDLCLTKIRFFFSEIETTTTSKRVISGGSGAGYKHLDVGGGKTIRHAPDTHKDGHTVGIIIGVLITTVLVVAVVRIR